jgi:hypothetical protein
MLFQQRAPSFATYVAPNNTPGKVADQYVSTTCNATNFNNGYSSSMKLSRESASTFSPCANPP